MVCVPGGGAAAPFSLPGAGVLEASAGWPAVDGPGELCLWPQVLARAQGEIGESRLAVPVSLQDQS